MESLGSKVSVEDKVSQPKCTLRPLHCTLVRRSGADMHALPQLKSVHEL